MLDYAIHGEVKPIFYIDDRSLGNPQAEWLLRGATEAACEEAWTIYADLAQKVPDQDREALLPLCHMVQATVYATTDDLKQFVIFRRGGATRPVGRTIAEGFTRFLNEQGL